MRVLVLILVLALQAQARPMLVDLVDIPVERLIANYQKRVEQAPGVAQNHYVLGRIQALAYALGTPTLKARKDESYYPGLFNEGDFPPRLPRVGGKASGHLQAALDEYARAVALDDHFLPARLGWAWCLDQAGHRQQALTQYRLVLERSWPEEKKAEHPSFGRSLSAETGGYLLNLLDPQSDAQERAQVQSIIDQASKLPRLVTPILIPLQPGLAFEQLIDRDRPVRFDLDGSGLPQWWGWITPRAAWLVYLDKRARVESGLQLFGTVSFYTFWEDGYQALGSLDADQDGQLSGAELEGLCLWRDANQDGRCDPGEVQPVGEAGIVSLSCRCQPQPGGFLYSPAGVTYRDGSSTPSYDWVPPAHRSLRAVPDMLRSPAENLRPDL